MGFAFHLGSWVMMKISFATLRNCYVVFVDWHRISCWIGARLPWKTIRERAAASAAPATPSPLPVATLVVGTLLVAGNIWAGALKQMDGWPLSCYPRFDGIVGESHLPCPILDLESIHSGVFLHIVRHDDEIVGECYRCDEEITLANRTPPRGVPNAPVNFGSRSIEW